MKLTEYGCRERQERLASILVDRGLDQAVISKREHVYYFTGCLRGLHHAAAALITADGHTTLVSQDDPDGLGIDEHIAYQAAAMSTMNSEQPERVAAALKSTLGGGRTGVDSGGGIAIIAELVDDPVDITRDVFRLRKKKHDDEIAALRDAIRLTDSMYATAKSLLRPGLDEVDLCAELMAVCVREAGELIEELGNDFRANAMGGKARRRAMRDGELYILDCGPVLHGYHADNCRTFAVNGTPTDTQLTAWQRLDSLFPILEATIEPGVPASDVFAVADEYLKWNGFQGMVHHLGHGIGMTPHEAPEVNPCYNAMFEIGDVFTLEPGVYSDELRAGIRLEEDYLLTEAGLEHLTSFPRDLA